MFVSLSAETTGCGRELSSLLPGEGKETRKLGNLKPGLARYWTVGTSFIVFPLLEKSQCCCWISIETCLALEAGKLQNYPLYFYCCHRRLLSGKQVVSCTVQFILSFPFLQPRRERKSEESSSWVSRFDPSIFLNSSFLKNSSCIYFFYWFFWP